MEAEAYGDKSYYYAKRMGLPPALPDHREVDDSVRVEITNAYSGAEGEGEGENQGVSVSGPWA